MPKAIKQGIESRQDIECHGKFDGLKLGTLSDILQLCSGVQNATSETKHFSVRSLNSTYQPAVSTRRRPQHPSGKHPRGVQSCVRARGVTC